MRRSSALILLALVCVCSVRGQTTTATAAANAGALTNAVTGLLQTMVGSVQTQMSNLATGASTLMQGAASLKAETLKSYSTVAKQLEEQVSAYEKQYCVAGAFKPGSKKPATFVGHSFALTFDSGSCYFNDTAYLVDAVKELNCTEPSISFVTTPANFTSSYHAPAAFTGPYCQISKAFGEPMEKVLYVFDGVHTSSDVLDVNALAARITTEVQKVLATMSSGLSNVGSNLFDITGSGATSMAGMGVMA